MEYKINLRKMQDVKKFHGQYGNSVAHFINRTIFFHLWIVTLKFQQWN